MNRLEEIVLSYREEITKTLSELVQIPSPQTESKPGMPFGEGPYQALQYALEKCRQLGFRTGDVDGYAGYAEIGSGDTTMGVLVHLDVVPAGDGWTMPPFSGLVKDGKVWGRGSTDNKCSAVASMYCMKALLDAGVELKQRIRLIFGTNEETDWDDIAYYKTKFPMPDYGYSPDASFPCFNAEKGIQVIRLSSSFGPETGKIRILSFQGGTAFNVVPAKASCTLQTEQPASLVTALADFAAKNGFDMAAEIAGDTVVVRAEGKAAHGSHTEGGKNAIGMIALFLDEIGAGAGQCRQSMKMLAETLGMEGDGAHLGVKLCDEPSGPLTCNLGVLHMDEKCFEAYLDIRQPVTVPFETVLDGVRKTAASYGVSAETAQTKDPLYMPKDHPMIQKFLGIYEQVTGEKAEPLSMGGGTYARAMKNAVAFGPSLPGMTGSGGAHQPDEHCDIDELMIAARIYVQVMAAFAG